MRRHKPLLAIVALAALAVMACAGALGAAEARVQPLSRLADARPASLWEVRHRLRHHRRRRGTGGAPSKAGDAESKLNAQPPERERPAAKNGPAAAPEPLGPPPPPKSWTAAEIEAARRDCDRRLLGLRALFERPGPVKEGVCGAPAPILLKGFENGKEPPFVFSPAPLLSCKLAEALRRWIGEAVEPNAKKHLQTSIARAGTLSAYKCRPRYDDPAQRMSQHAYANALDVSEFVTVTGERISVQDDWNDKGERSAFLHAIHDGACAIFGTTLGPEANGSHRNHFHLDMKERRQPLCDFTPGQLRARQSSPVQPWTPAGANGETSAQRDGSKSLHRGSAASDPLKNSR